MKIALTIILIALAAWTTWSWWSVYSLEEPSYEVVEKRSGYEIRRYDPYIVAEATVSGPYRDGLNDGFRIIADYIFGNNTAQQKIAMTAPVVEQPISEKIAMTVPVIESPEEEGRIIAFVMPSAYTLETLPIPNNSQVRIREVPDRYVAALRFGWYPTEARVENKKNTLKEALANDNIEMLGGISSAFYNPPFSMPLLLRNEVLVDIERTE